MTPAEMARGLECGRLPPEGFHHAQHLAVAWAYLDESPTLVEASARMTATLHRFAASVGQPAKYHHTATLFWMRRLAAERARHPGAALEDILRRAPDLLDKTLPLTYYSPGRWFSDEARRTWLDPDLRPLGRDVSPAGPAHSSDDAPDRGLSRPAR